MKMYFIIVALPLFLLFATNSNSQMMDLKWINHINEIQDEWISIEKQTFGIWDNISKFQNFKFISERTKDLLAKISIMKDAHEHDMALYGNKYPGLFRISTSYIASLEQSIQTLRTILERLNHKTKDDNSYLWKEYKKDLDKYNLSVSKYHEFGSKLNIEFNKLQ